MSRSNQCNGVTTGRGVCVAAGLLTIALASGVLAQTPPSYEWKSVTVRAGGYIPNIIFSRAQKDLAYIRTDIGGPYKWSAADKKWLPLLDWCGTYNYFGTESIAPDPVDANKVYMACGMYGTGKASIMRSSDGGATFEITEVPFSMGGNENGRGMGERLAIDPDNTRTLYFASRHDGLWKSTDSAVTWAKVDSFPGKVNGRGTGGLSFVLFARAAGEKVTKADIYVGNSERGSAGLFRSHDGGATWEAVPGQPPEGIFPTHADIDANGVIYFSYANSPSPSGASDGGVFTLDTTTDTWADISPMKPNVDGHPAFGYGAVSVDRQRPGTAICSTIQRDTKPGGDDLYRTTDSGKTWASVSQTPGLHEDRDVSMQPYLKTLANPEQWFGWWMTGIAIDPFDSNHACYTTGATIYNTNDLTQMDKAAPSHWNTWVDGTEETACLFLMSPTQGPALYSGFGDIGGFVHTQLDALPPAQYTHPKFGNTQGMDYAGQKPSVVVRNGTPSGPGSAPYGYSENFGATWEILNVPAEVAAGSTPASRPATAVTSATRPGGFRRAPVGFGEGTPSLIVSADGATFLLLTNAAQYTRDRGATWSAVAGLPPNTRVVADRVNDSNFYGVDVATRQVFTSVDSGATFTAAPITGLPDAPPANAGGNPTNGGARVNNLHLWQGIDRSGDLWLVGGSVMFHSTDGGHSFARLEHAPNVAVNGRCFGLGKSAPGRDYPSLFVAGNLDGKLAVFRSDDVGLTWLRINDDRHQYGLGFEALTADPRVFGRVYVGFNGRGIVYGDVAK